MIGARLERLVGEVRDSGGQPAGEIALVDPTTIGRAPESTVQLPSPAVSREHARIVQRDGAWVIEDLGSRNGVTVGGLRIEGSCPLADGAVIGISDVRLRYVAPVEMTIVDSVSVRDAGPGRLGVDPEAALAGLLQLSEDLRGALDLERVHALLLEGLLRLFPTADRAIVVTHAADGVPEVTLERTRDDAGGCAGCVSRTLVEQACERGAAILSEEALPGDNVIQSLAERAVRSAMCAPLLSRDDCVFGAIAVETFRDEEPFKAAALGVFGAAVNAAAFAVEGAILHGRRMADDRLARDLEHARQLQRQFLPSAPPAVSGYGFASWYEPAAAVGGDAYDFVSLPAERVGLVIADVSGKGLPAALLMARVSSDIRYALTTTSDPGRALERVNRSLCESAVSAHFVTMVVAVLDPAAHRLDVGIAGHPPPRLVEGGVARPIAEGVAGRPINIDADAVYETASIDVPSGAALWFYTDGVPDMAAPDGVRFGDARTVEEIAASSGRDAPERLAGFRTVIEKFRSSAKQIDDATVLVLERERG